MTENRIEEEILRALRRITRAIDLRSRKLANTFGLTGPQLVCLRALLFLGQTTPSKLAREISLSQGTVTGILDRLLARQLIKRNPSKNDRRLVEVELTDAGAALVKQAPSPLQEQFLEQLEALPLEEQESILRTLSRIVDMMGGGQLEAAAVLSTSPAAQSEEEVKDVLNTGEVEVALRAEFASGTESDESK